MEVLLGAGAGVDLPTWQGVTPLQLASSRGNLALARLLLDWGASTGGSSLPITATSYPALNLAPIRTYPDLVEEEELEEVKEQEEKLVPRKNEVKMKKQKDKKVTTKKEDEEIEERGSWKKRGKLRTVKVVSKSKETKVTNETGINEKDKMLKLKDDQELSHDSMVLRASCEVCGERGGTLRKVEGLVVCLPCTKQQQTSYSSTASSTAFSTVTKATRRARKAAQK